MRVKAGVKKDGTLTALQLTGTGEVGAYPGGTSAAYQFLDLYKCPNVRISEVSAMINAGQARAFRAPGFPQGNWALEQMHGCAGRKDRHGSGGTAAQERFDALPGGAESSRTLPTGCRSA